MNDIVILDYGYGNLFSIKSALNELGIAALCTKDYDKIINAKLIILPGVGSFYQAMKAIEDLHLDIAIKQALKNKSKILGICLGYQMLFEESEEFGINKGLGLIKGKVISLNTIKKLGYRIPNVGWRNILINKNNNSLAESFNGKMVYFVHSFVPQAVKENEVSTFIKFGDTKIHSSIHTKNIVGFQFHPEKSGEIGLLLLKDTISYLT